MSMDITKIAYPPPPPPEEISPVALGLISDPPTIVLTYDLQKKAYRFGEKRITRRKRKMPLRDFTDRSNVKRFSFNLRQRHVKYLSQVTDVTLEKMLRVIQEIQKGSDVGTSLTLVNKEYSVDPEEDLNTLSPAQLAQRKSLMEETFRKNLIRPGDPGYVYDKEVDFENDKTVGDPAADGNDWDEVEDDDEKKTTPAPNPDDDNAKETSDAVKANDKVEDDKPVQDIDKEVASAKLSPEAKDREPENKLPLKENVNKPEGLYQIKEHLPSLRLDEDEALLKSLSLQEHANLAITPSHPQGTESSSPNPDKPSAPAQPKHYDNCSTSSDIEEALENLEIETGVLDEEDEDFWT